MDWIFDIWLLRSNSKIGFTLNEINLLFITANYKLFFYLKIFNLFNGNMHSILNESNFCKYELNYPFMKYPFWVLL